MFSNLLIKKCNYSSLSNTKLIYDMHFGNATFYYHIMKDLLATLMAIIVFQTLFNIEYLTSEHGMITVNSGHG